MAPEGTVIKTKSQFVIVRDDETGTTVKLGGSQGRRIKAGERISFQANLRTMYPIAHTWKHIKQEPKPKQKVDYMFYDEETGDTLLLGNWETTPVISGQNIRESPFTYKDFCGRQAIYFQVDPYDPRFSISPKSMSPKKIIPGDYAGERGSLIAFMERAGFWKEREALEERIYKELGEPLPKADCIVKSDYDRCLLVIADPKYKGSQLVSCDPNNNLISSTEFEGKLIHNVELERPLNDLIFVLAGGEPPIVKFPPLLERLPFKPNTSTSALHHGLSHGSTYERQELSRLVSAVKEALKH